MSDYSNEIGRFNSFGNGFGTIDGVDIGRYNLLTNDNIISVGSKLRCARKYENLALGNTIWVNYQPRCADKMIRGAGKMINGIYKKIGDIQISDVVYDGIQCVNIQFKVKRLDVYDPFEFKINDENGKYNWQSLRKDVPYPSLHTIGSMGKISQANACKDVIDHIKINYAIKIQRWFRNVQKSSKGKKIPKPSEKTEMEEMMAKMKMMEARVAEMEATMDRRTQAGRVEEDAEEIQKKHDDWNSKNGVVDLQSEEKQLKAKLDEVQTNIAKKIAENPHKIKDDSVKMAYPDLL